MLIKDETRNPLRCFKGRGAGLAVTAIDPGRHVVCASSGNFGQAIAHAARRAGLPCTVFLPAGANPVARERIEAFGADVLVVDDEAELGRRAADYAGSRADRELIEDGRRPAIAEGAGTIGIELLAGGPLDAVILPVGDGALITGVACWIKDRSPRTRVIGVCPESSPSMAVSWRSGRATPGPAHTIADGLRTHDPLPESVERMRQLVDQMLLVSDAALVAAMRLASRTTGVLLEPSGAAGLAAIREHRPPGDRIATVFTGGTLRPEHLDLLARSDREWCAC